MGLMIFVAIFVTLVNGYLVKIIWYLRKEKLGLELQLTDLNAIKAKVDHYNVRNQLYIDKTRDIEERITELEKVSQKKLRKVNENRDS